MASYTYSLLDLGDGATAAYFGTASMSAINAEQSINYDSIYVEEDMKIDTEYLEWAGTEDSRANFIGIFPPELYAEELYKFPSIIDGLANGSSDLFEWPQYSLVKDYTWSLSMSTYWYLENTNEEGTPIKLNSFYLRETYQILPDSYDIVTSPEMTIVWRYDQRPFDTPDSGYQNLGASDPRVTGITDDKASYTYTDGELAGIRTKFASPAGSTSLSLMQAVISSSVDKIYNTSNISRFNFKKTRAEALKPREVSSIDLVKDFNRPYRGTTSG